MAWSPKDRRIIDIGGSQLNLTFEDQLPKAFDHKADFPKEVAYTSGMDKWVDIADRSYQTSDEMAIIEATAAEVVAQMPSGTKIIDLGAANSMKFEPYAREFFKQGKTCTYVPLDLCKSSLTDQINRAKTYFPTMKCVGLWGSFQHGDQYFNKIPGDRLFLSLGSIFYNAPDEMCKDRCQEFRRHLSASDRLIVGQDGPTGTESAKSHASYNTKEYDAFFTCYLEGIQSHAGIDADAKLAWSYESKMVSSMHYFEVIAKQTMVCKNFNNFVVESGTIYKMFPSWKRGEAEIHEITKKERLAIKTLGKADNSGMRQYLIQAE
ncbi:hypothetical protein BGZ61DRAFT_346712 [Ilyonectria robusta]|uniref:uncharacterized protein n=1 Tax=Ilyonectria robusta TaxID=1079257 RepID=UPI001E8CC65F|nr:uncharacterized protein BGZ61DRAFT_346712 [Ilyonectria robusta]KAH8729884.1 hypothetical protein BGZ61DRAFT_346712 [Ilyonectria robusta]